MLSRPDRSITTYRQVSVEPEHVCTELRRQSDTEMSRETPPSAYTRNDVQSFHFYVFVCVINVLRLFGYNGFF